MCQRLVLLETRTWLITGCSSVFGEQFVCQLTALGHNVVATGRNAETRLAHLKDTGAAILESQPLAAYGSVNVIVHNAEELQLPYHTMVRGPLNLTRSALPYFRDRGHGWLVFMGSQAGFVGELSPIRYSWLAPGVKPLLIASGIFNTEAMKNVHHASSRTEVVEGKSREEIPRRISFGSDALRDMREKFGDAAEDV
ncbi:hydroxybutyrate dehydrogenase [Xylariaceae sp. FL0255]|nr:hydroxybutyrate dehydrogenase [Xylariaceae sp. FL0255]